MINETFAPRYGTNTAVVTGASAAAELGEGSKSILLTNTGSEIVYVRVGLSNAVATAADYPVLPLTQVSISKFQDDTHIATFSAAPGAIQVMAGEGF